ncbi:MAG TPA: putative PEP-binding protein, partial [Gemmata sp.]|nr:putative PEP-binding protein [Gemmata sp.]
MEVKRGIAVSPGVAIGPALVLDTEGIRITHRTIPAEQIDDEVKRLLVVLYDTATEMRETRQRFTARLGPTWGNIFGAQETAIDALREPLERLIRTQSYSAEYAVSCFFRDYVKRMEDAAARLSESYRAEARRRSAEFIDIEKQVLVRLLGQNSEPLQELTEPVIILAQDLLPSDTAEFSPRTVHAFATESGGNTSHTAILAGALEIPAIVGIGRFLTDVSGGDTIIVDGDDGWLIIDPDEATIARYEEKRAADRSRADRYDSLRDKPALTLDMTRIQLLGNIELSGEAAHCLDRGAEGVGLYRTEFLYLNKSTDPTEAEQYDAYCSVVQTLGSDRPVVIRTLDLGADKFSSVSRVTGGAEKNPFLGLRSVRLCLQNLDLFKTQLRAILRVAVLGNVRIMFPM